MATANEIGLPAWSIQLLAEIDRADSGAREVIAGLTTKQLNWQATPASWSIGQCIEHLALTNDTYLPPMAEAVAGVSPRMVQEITPGWAARWFIRSYFDAPLPGKRASAPKKIVPPSHVELSVLDRFARGNQTLREFVRHAGGFDVNRVRFWNPFIPGVRFTVGSGLRIIAKHQHRHLLQARRVRESAGFPAN